jgi:hypothetical protein
MAFYQITIQRWCVVLTYMDIKFLLTCVLTPVHSESGCMNVPTLPSLQDIKVECASLPWKAS